ncbi:candidate olfactory receptor [Bombyx mori]|uniref:Gustatory receptor n=1 Tax=Bombyx mori TaxID=7091 RepID=Q0EEF4_BOMMO|nr:candidate olfactory receptor [Bombyx mori]BAF31196.1 candidate olfactory receptor [Bombyx mori]
MTMSIKPRLQCMVPPSLALALRVSRLAGIAPLKFVAKQSNIMIRLSTSLCVYSYLLVTALNVCTLIAVMIDFSVPVKLSIRMQTETKRFVWIADVVIMGILSGVGVYTAPIQMRRLIAYLHRIHKINSDLGTYSSSLTDKMLHRLTIGMLLITSVIIVTDFTFVMYLADLNHRQLLIAIMYWCYYCSYFIAHLLEMQFVLIAALALSSLKLVNNGLRTLLHQSGIESLTEIPNSNEQHTANAILPQPPKKSVNNSIDTLAFVVTKRSVRFPTAGWMDQRTIRRLALSYGSICEVVRQIDNNNGIIVLLLLASFLLHLVVTPYYLIISFVTESPHTGFEKVLNPILQTVWCLYHTFGLVMIIEPCHRTHEEMETTRELVSRVMCSADPRDPISIELEMFFRQLVLNKASYAPLKVCTLTRSLVATILGSITTYLIVIVQLEIKNMQ